MLFVSDPWTRSTDVPVVPDAHHAKSTLIDSTPGVLKAWETFGKDYSLNAEEVAHASHGRRLYDTLKEFCRIDDEDKLQVRFPLLAPPFPHSASSNRAGTLNPR